MRSNDLPLITKYYKETLEKRKQAIINKNNYFDQYKRAFISIFDIQDILADLNNIILYTDASIKSIKMDNEKIRYGCPGFIPVGGGMTIKPYTHILYKSTNNESEVYAVYMALYYALYNKFCHYKDIYIVSDSKITIEGLRSWVFDSWTIRNGDLFTSSGQHVSNQTIFKNIIYMISACESKVHFIHINGHINVIDMENLKTAHQSFLIQNKMDTDIQSLFTMATFNNFIDLETRNRLDNLKEQSCFENYRDRGLLPIDNNIQNYFNVGDLSNYKSKIIQ